MHGNHSTPDAFMVISSELPAVITMVNGQNMPRFLHRQYGAF
jgi:electron transfer flavoprotein alpha/beta subunit